MCYIIGTKSTFNGNDDGILRVKPQEIIPIESLANELKGEIKIILNFEQIKKGMLGEIGSWVNSSVGRFKLLTNVQTESMDSYTLESRKSVFPDNKILAWLEKEKISFQIRIITNA